MKQFFALIGVNAFSIICLGITAYMIYTDKDYWGWVLVVAALSSSTINSIKL
jgi:hypothetical protein